jgi:hypothetical protein
MKQIHFLLLFILISFCACQEEEKEKIQNKYENISTKWSLYTYELTKYDTLYSDESLSQIVETNITTESFKNNRLTITKNNDIIVDSLFSDEDINSHYWTLSNLDNKNKLIYNHLLNDKQIETEITYQLGLFSTFHLNKKYLWFDDLQNVYFGLTRCTEEEMHFSGSNSQLVGTRKICRQEKYQFQRLQ